MQYLPHIHTHTYTHTHTTGTDIAKMLIMKL